MERHIIIETYSRYNTVWVYEAVREFTENGVVYKRSSKDAALIFGLLSPKLYGQLDALIVTADKIEKAEPITPEVQQPLTPTRLVAETAGEGAAGETAAPANLQGEES
jgi:hypothetical protein